MAASPHNTEEAPGPDAGADAPPDAGAFVSVRAVTKSFGGVHALEDVHLDIAPAEVHALCGENGAGKSTLIKVLAGSVVPDSGAVEVSGAPLALGDVRASEAAGIAVIHQESTAFPHLSPEDNVFAGCEPTLALGMLLDREAMRSRTRALLDRLGESFDTRAPLEELSVAQRQMVAIARALSRECRMLIMDEPTASLSSRETEVLFRIIRELRGRGVSVLYVSHRLEEVFELADRVTVLRDGRFVATSATADIDRAGLVRLMVGREVDEDAAAGEGRDTPQGAPLLELRGLTRDGVFTNVSLSVHAGEVVGLAGLVGAGRSEVARAAFGIDRADSGEVRVGGRPLAGGSAREAMAAGVALVPEDRQHEGLVLPMTVGENVSLPVLRTLTRRGLVSRERERELVEGQMRDLTVKAAGPDVAAGTLSGGNQQKVLVAKWLATAPKALILDEPTRGVDVGAKAEIRRLIRELAAKGMATLVISSELPELLALSDRVVVMREGVVSGELAREDATQEKVLELALPQEGGASGPDGSAKTEGDALPDASVPAWRRLVARISGSREYGVLALLVLTVIGVSIKNPSFLLPGNIRDMLVNAAPSVIVGCGLMLVIVTAEIDISMGSLMSLLAAVAGITMSASRWGLPVPVGMLLVLGLGAGVGVANGALVVYGRVPSIIVTLGMLTALRGVTVLVMGGDNVLGLPGSLRFFGTGTVLGAPVSVLTAAVVVGFTILLARRTPLGRRIYATGSNRAAARLVGISERRIKLFVFAYTGVLVGIATLVSAPQLTVIQSNTGDGFELLVVTCVVVGGTAISGGRGTVAGTVLACFLLGIVRTVLTYLKLGDRATYWERAIQGAFILAAVLADHLARRRRGTGVGR
ncbi:MAG: ATP-binding cassette domain-containing protein [Planctomycetota bacterium]|jgi:ABC-type sugar transport system ATPase subunit/ribose/xylose/arabinose/galactoside ABC-type transport system permease subunit